MMIKKIIHWIIDQKLESIDDYPALAEPIAEEFGIDVGVADGIVLAVIDWETNSTTIDSLEEFLGKKFPTYVTK